MLERVKGRLVLALPATVLAGALVVSAAAGGRSRAVVKTAFNTALKKSIVVDGKGRTLYLFTEDTKGKATCATVDPRCRQIWPALTTTGKPSAGAGIKAPLLGTTKGAGGKTQVTYNRRPLYYFHGGFGITGDRKPGDVLGQNFAGVWFVLSPKGTPIKS